MAMTLKDRPIIITGGGTGIGAATALACAGEGMPVLLAGRRAEPLTRIQTLITEGGGSAAISTVDVTDEEHADALLDLAETTFGPPWAVFANAGRGLDRPGHRTADDEMRAIFEVNFFSAHRLMAAAAHRMIDAKNGGHLLACASCVSKFSPPYHGAYAATKASMDLMCQSMRIELAPFGIHVSTVHPITTVTDFFDESAKLSGRTEHSSGLHHTPKFLRQRPERVARAIVRCLRRPRPEVWTSTLVRTVSAVRTLMPKLMDREFRKMVDLDRTYEAGAGGGSGRTSMDQPSSEGSDTDIAAR
ncbi:MAG: SDR family oxidoreductase [Phycisphaerales bacterium]|nr:SDR family oxidoreductase [Phycisphaerales bacterium]